MTIAGGDPVAALLDPAIDPLFWASMLPHANSAWHGHVPFAHWIVAHTKPRVVVELGTHAGVSYAGFCQAVQLCKLDTTCRAVDTWEGDPQAGIYGEDVFADVSAFHDAHFAGFSRLLRKTFDAALADVADGSVDLLHIDGFHSYEAVRHDFQTWTPKLSDRAVVLFHDTNVHTDGFGVWRFWDEIQRTGYGSFAFLHSHGLGVLQVGAQVSSAIAALCAGPVEPIRARFAALGARMVHEAEAHAGPEIHEALPATPPLVDETLDLGRIFIAERFKAPAGLNALRLPRDAVTRVDGDCTVWVVSPGGHGFRQGRVNAAPDESIVTLVFAPFDQAGTLLFHLFVTEACDEASGLPVRLLDLLGNRRPPIALDTSPVASAGLSGRRITVVSWAEA